jgi:hypothetical protein
MSCVVCYVLPGAEAGEVTSSRSQTSARYLEGRWICRSGVPHSAGDRNIAGVASAPIASSPSRGGPCAVSCWGALILTLCADRSKLMSRKSLSTQSLAIFIRTQSIIGQAPAYLVRRASFRIMTQRQFDATIPVRLPQTFGQLRCKPVPAAPTARPLLVVGELYNWAKHTGMTAVIAPGIHPNSLRNTRCKAESSLIKQLGQICG